MIRQRSFQLSDEAQAVMACVDAYEQAPPTARADLRLFLRDVPTPVYGHALAELVRVDFELRWSQGARPNVQHYLARYPDLQEARESLLDLLQTEYEYRAQAGDQPDIAEYRTLLPEFAPRTASNHSQVTEKFETPPPEERKAEHPTIIGRYRIDSKIDEGGFGVVYLGYDSQLQRQVAIKISHSAAEGTGPTSDQVHEARSVGNLDHPGIVKVFEINETPEGIGYVVYEYISGGTLKNRIQRRDYTLAEAVEWCAQIAEALHYAHQSRVVHRDIKPGNILIDSSGRAKVVDFGLARRDDKFFVDETGVPVGTALYMSPEQARGEAHWATAQADLYSLGVVLYELICHQRPFTSTTTKELLQQVRFRTPAPPRSLNDKIPKPLEDVCLKAMQKEAGPRFKTGREMAAALRKSVRPTSQLRVAAAGLALAAVAVLAAAMFYTEERRPPATLTKPTISTFGVFANDDSIRDLQRPLSPRDTLQVQTSFDQPAYGYVFSFEQGGQARLLWPQDPSAKRPPDSDDIVVNDLSLSDADGATLLVALASARPLTSAEVDSLLSERVDLGILSAEVPSKAFVCLTRHNALKLDPEPPLVRGGTQVPAEFKEKLAKLSDAYAGFVVAHRKAVDSTGQQP